MLVRTMSLDKIKVPSHNIVLRNPFFETNGHPQAMIKCMWIQKIEDPHIDQTIEHIVNESEFDLESEDIFLSTLIDQNNKGFSNVVNSSQRVDIARRFVMDGWKLEPLE